MGRCPRNEDAAQTSGYLFFRNHKSLYPGTDYFASGFPPSALSMELCEAHLSMQTAILLYMPLGRIRA